MINWRLYILGGLLACLFAVAFYIAHLQTEARVAKKAATDAQAQTVVSEGVASAVDRTIIRERTITEETVNVIRQIDSLENGQALVPDDVSRIWADGIDSLHKHSSTPNSDNTGKPQNLPKD
jgi:hypothetical protein